MRNSSGFLANHGVSFLSGKCVDVELLEKYKLNPNKLITVYPMGFSEEDGFKGEECYTSNDTSVRKAALQVVSAESPRGAIKKLRQEYNYIFNVGGIKDIEEKNRRFNEGVPNLIDLLKDAASGSELVPQILRNEPILTVAQQLRSGKTKLVIKNSIENELSDLKKLEQEFDMMRQIDIRKMQSYDLRRIPDTWTVEQF